MALIDCDECGGQVSEKAKTCPTCGASIKSQIRSRTPLLKRRYSSIWYAVVFIALIAATGSYVMGNYHIITGHKGGTIYLEKQDFTFKETFISHDEIVGVPYITAVSRFPMAVQQLERKGYIKR